MGAGVALSPALSYSRERAERAELPFYSIPAVFVVASAVSAIALKEVAKILCLGVRGSTQERFDAEDFLQRFQRGTVVVVDGIAKAFLPPPFANGERMNMPIGPSLNFPLSSASSQMMKSAPPSLYSSDSVIRGGTIRKAVTGSG
jgi:hypothetical protein